MSIPTLPEPQWLVGCAVVLASYVTFQFVRRLRRADGDFRSFGAWLRDLFDVDSGRS